jgi:hypothetical protein
MTEKSEIEQQREADRRLALLALVSEQPEPFGACLEPEELSALVEGRLTPEQTEPCLTHLAGCERCYALWLRLDREWRGQTGRSNRNTLRRLISRPRFLAAAGSLLAAAASIAVFLNITADHHSLLRLPEQPARELAQALTPAKPAEQAASEPEVPAPAGRSLQPQIQPQDNQAIDRTDKQRADGQTVAPGGDDAKRRARSVAVQTQDHAQDAAAPAQRKATAPAITAQAEKKAEQSPLTADRATSAAPAATGVETRNQTGPTTADQETTAPLAGSGKAAPSDAPQPAMRTAAAPPAAEKTMPAPTTFAAWQTELRQGCQGQPGPEFFAAVSAQGTQLLRESAVLAKQERRRIERVLALTGGNHTPAEQCRAMLDILGPEAPSPGQ